IVPLHDHRHAVADEDRLDAGRVDQGRHRIVVGGEHRDLLAGAFERLKIKDGNALRPGGHAASPDRERWLSVRVLSPSGRKLTTWGKSQHPFAAAGRSTELDAPPRNGYLEGASFGNSGREAVRLEVAAMR